MNSFHENYNLKFKTLSENFELVSKRLSNLENDHDNINKKIESYLDKEQFIKNHEF